MATNRCLSMSGFMRPINELARIMRIRKRNYNNLYINILKIGVSQLDQGLSYTLLKEKLEKKGYDFSNDCIELAVKQWFINCFQHYMGPEDIAEMGEIKTVDDLERHLYCNFVLEGKACLTYVEHRKSKRNLILAYVAIVIAVLSLLSQVPLGWTTATTESTKTLNKHEAHTPIHPNQDTTIHMHTETEKE